MSLAAPVASPARRHAVLAPLAVVVTAASTLTVATLAAAPARAATAFTPDDVVVYRVGTGAAALSSAATATFVDEFSPTGAAVQSVAMPTVVSGSNKILTNSGSATSEGLLTLSPNGRFLTLAGYNAAVGTASVAGSSTSTVSRTVAVLGTNGAVDTTTSITDAFSGNNARSAATVDGTAFWATGGTSGVRYAVKGASNSTQVTDTSTATAQNLRQVVVAGGQLYVTSSSKGSAGPDTRVAAVGTGTPTTGPQSVNLLPGAINTSANSPYQVAFLSLRGGSTPDTAYVADATAGAVQKYSLAGGSWGLTGSVGGLTGVTGVAANVYGGQVRIYATTPTGLYRFADTSGAGGTMSGAPGAAIATASTNTAFRGVAFAPGTTLNGGTTTPAVGAPTVTTTSNALAAALGDTTNPTLAATVAAGTDATYPVDQLTVTATSSNPTVVPSSGVAVTGTGANRTVTVTPAGVGTSTITLTVTAPDDQTGTAAFTYGVSADQGDPSDRYLAGAGNASAAVDVGGGYALVGDDESDVIRLYDTTRSGLPAATFDFTAQLPYGTAEVDIEGAARSGDTIYWMGSMSTSSSGRVAPARSTLFATTVTGSGAATSLAYAGANTNLQSDLVNWDVTDGHGLGANYFGFDHSVNGGIANHAVDAFNLEGMEFAAGSSTTAYLAFRAPIVPASNRTRALLVPVTNVPRLLAGNAVHATFGAPIQWDLGGLGVRDIKANSDGTFVVVAGTADATNSTFTLYTWDGDPSDPPLAGQSLPLVPASPGQGAWETIVAVPSPLTAGTSTLRLVQDNGETDWYGTGATSKNGLALPLQKDLLRTFTYTAPTLVPTTTTLAASATQVRAGDDVTFTVTVTGAAGGPNGRVRLSTGGGVVTGCGSIALDANGRATCTTRFATPGDRVVTAAYAGNAVYASSSSDPVTVGVANALVPTTTTIAASDRRVAIGATVTFTATVAAGSGTPSGTVSFGEAGTALSGCAAVPVAADGTATCATSYAHAGTHRVVASFSGDDPYTASASDPVVVTVLPTTVTVTARDVTSTFGAPDPDFTYTVDPPVTFTTPPTCGVTGDHTAVGTYPIVCSGADAGPDHTVTYADGTLTVAKADPTVVVTSSPADPAAGQSLTLVATVDSGTDTTATGTVAFAVDGTPVAGCDAVPVDNGTASCPVDAGFGAGTVAVTATYSGDDSFLADTGSASVTVGPAAATVTVAVAPAAPVSGQSLTLTATVTSAGPDAPTGSVAFSFAGGASCGPVAVDASGTATCLLSGGLPAGSDTVTASYGGDPATVPASASAGVVVGTATTSTALTADVAAPVSGQPVTLTARVAVELPGAGRPTGTVRFTAAGNAVPGCTDPVAVDATGTAQCVVSDGFDPGAYRVAAAYSGDTDLDPSVDAMRITVATASVRVDVTASPSPPVVGSPTTIRAAVSAVAPGAGVPTGTVVFTVTTDKGATLTCRRDGNTVALDNGVATCVIPAGQLRNGPAYTVTAAYAGDARFATGSGSLAQTASVVDTTTAVSSGANPSSSGAAVRLRATVSPEPGTVRPTGTVTFTVTGADGTRVACASSNTQPVVNRAATCQIDAGGLTASNAPYAVTADYSGSDVDRASTGMLTQRVRPAATRVVVTQSANPTPAGTPATFTATVTASAAGPVAPTGTVTFTAVDPQGNVVTCAGDGTLTSAGTASCTIAGTDLSVARGPYRVTATYSGDADHTGSTVTVGHRVVRPAG